jgi:nucleoside-diphosphate-sugar epimerase
VVGDGRNRWSSVHVDDVAALYLAVLEQGQTSVRALAPRERVFHAMSGSAERVGDIAQAANRAAGGRGVVKLQSVAEARAQYGAVAEALAMDQVVRAPRTERVLGFRPKVSAFVPYAPRAFEEYSSV